MDDHQHLTRPLYLRLAIILIPLIAGVVAVLYQPAHPTVVLEMEMVPIENSAGEYILEYSNGTREILRKDGTRQILTKAKQ